MRISEITIKNYRSFDPAGQTIKLPPLHCAFVGKNNSGKSNIFAAINLLLGTKNPRYVELEEEDFFDKDLPFEIKIVISDIAMADKNKLFSIPNLTKQQMGALVAKIGKGDANAALFLRRNFGGTPQTADEDEDEGDKFQINLWGFEVRKKLEDVRRALIRVITVHAIRDPKSDLSASTWTHYGQLMKEVLEGSPKYGEIKTLLGNLNTKIEEAFQQEKRALLRNARISAYVEDVSFQLTKDNKPSELLRNLEIFVKEHSKLFNIDRVGTGTQSAIIIAMLELVLKSKKARNKLFCIEEPEAFIHPHGIRYLGSLIKLMTDEQNTQILVSTHSLSLVANFSPDEIIRVVKLNGKTEIKQSTSLPREHFKRFINQDNAELLFSDKVIFVEGPTEKFLFSSLDKVTPQDPSKPKGPDCNFDRKNIGVVSLNSVNSILSHFRITNAFEIPALAIVDRDFTTSSACTKLCKEMGIAQPSKSEAQLIADLRGKGVLINTKGETEDLFPDVDIAAAAGVTEKDVRDIKAKHVAARAKESKPPKTSEAFEDIFGTGKPEYTIKLIDYYIENQKPHPLADVIRKLYIGDDSKITF